MTTCGMGAPHKTSTRTYKTSNADHMQKTLAAGLQCFLNWMVFRASHWPQVAKGDCTRIYNSRCSFYV